VNLLPTFAQRGDIANLLNRIHHCDALDLLKRLPDGSIDLQIFDPPYGKGYKASWKTANNRKKARHFSAETFNDVMDTSFLKEAFRVLKDGGAAYLFTQWDVEPIWRSAMVDAGFQIKMLLIWDKRHWGAGDLDSYGCQTEMILFATKGKHKLNWPKREGNLWSITKLDTINNEGNFDNPTQKPESLIRRMITRSSKAGDIVLDCHVGSGTTARAAQTLQRNFCACDNSVNQVCIGRSRIEKPVMLSLFAS
jgi:site-specific DNA-methyltransferase (adenine-specific)